MARKGWLAMTPGGEGGILTHGTVTRTTVFEFLDSHAGTCRIVAKGVLWFANFEMANVALYSLNRPLLAWFVCNSACKLSPLAHVRLPRQSRHPHTRVQCRLMDPKRSLEHGIAVS